MAKVKMKTKKCAAKRFKLTGSGKLVRRQAGRKHLISKKRRRRVRALFNKAEVDSTDMDRVKEQLPYMKYTR